MGRLNVVSGEPGVEEPLFSIHSCFRDALICASLLRANFEHMKLCLPQAAAAVHFYGKISSVSPPWGT